MRKSVAGIGWGVILLVAGTEHPHAAPPCPPQQAKEVRIGHRAWRVEVAHTKEERARGLSGRQAIPSGTAMWFVLPQPGIHGFWMQDMAFAVDLAWVAPGGRLLGVETLPPCQAASCPIHYPPEPASFVLETAAGSLPDLEDTQVTWHCETD